MANFSQIARIAFRNFGRFRLQTSLAAFTAGLGIASLLVSTGYAESGRQKILDQFTRLGADTISILPSQSRTIAGRARTGSVVETLTNADYLALKRGTNSVALSSATVTASFRLRALDLTKEATVIGCEPDYFRIKSWATTDGSVFTDLDLRRQARVVLLGAGLAKALFGPDSGVGQRVMIGRVPFLVVGVLSERGQSLDSANEDDQAYIPLTTASHRLLNIDHYNSILLDLKHGENVDAVKARIVAVLHQRHKWLSPAGDDFQVQTERSVVDAQLAAFSRLMFLAKLVGGGALIVSGFSEAGLCWIAIRNRTREIGIRRAIGATRADILVQFLLETLSGCVCGIWIGAMLAYPVLIWIDRLFGQPFVWNPQTLVYSIGSSVAIFATFVTLTSLRAAWLDPVKALAVR